MDDRKLISVGTAARMLGVPHYAVLGACVRGDLEHVVVGRHRRIPLDVVRGLLESRGTR